jgi:hypothetical protein
MGYLEGGAAVNLFSLSGVSTIDLGNIYTLADLDGDNRLSQNEFLIAMKLIKARMAGMPVPAMLPPELIAFAQQGQALGGGASYGGASYGGVSYGGGVVSVLEQRVVELTSKLSQSEQQISALQMEVNKVKEERDQALLQKQDALARAGQAQAQVSLLGSQNQQHNSQAMARINELAAQLEGNQQKMQEMHAYNAQLEAQLLQQAQQLQAARQQTEQYAYQAAQAQAQAQAQVLAANANPFAQPSLGGNPFGAQSGFAGNPFGGF